MSKNRKSIMKKFEIHDGFDLPYSTDRVNKDYSQIQGSDNLHQLFAKLRESPYFDPFRDFDWENERWYVGDNYWSGFWVSKEDAENLTFEELFYNLASAQYRTYFRRSMN